MIVDRPSPSATSSADDDWRGYPGSKSPGGTWRRICSWMPKHSVYVEPFLGHGAILRNKLPAKLDVGIDKDVAVTRLWRHRRPGVLVFCADAVDVLSAALAWLDPSCLIYLDPPYLRSVRKRRRYRIEFDQAREHTTLLTMLQGARCRVMISGYSSPLYDELLVGWRCETYIATTRGGPREECCWMNFREDVELHDTRFVGDGYRERERIRRKANRWVSNLAKMDPAERQAIVRALLSSHAGGGEVVPPP